MPSLLAFLGLGNLFGEGDLGLSLFAAEASKSRAASFALCEEDCSSGCQGRCTLLLAVRKRQQQPQSSNLVKACWTHMRSEVDSPERYLARPCAPAGRRAASPAGGRGRGAGRHASAWGAAGPANRPNFRCTAVAAR